MSLKQFVIILILSASFLVPAFASAQTCDFQCQISAIQAKFAVIQQQAGQPITTSNSKNVAATAGFVTVSGDKLMLNGAEYRIQGAVYLGGRYIAQFPAFEQDGVTYEWYDWLEVFNKFDEQEIEKELQILKNTLDINTIRIMLPAQPGNDQWFLSDGSISPAYLGRLTAFLSIANRLNLKVAFDLLHGISDEWTCSAGGVVGPCSRPLPTYTASTAFLIPPGSARERFYFNYLDSLTAAMKNNTALMSYSISSETLLNPDMSNYWRETWYDQKELSLVRRMIQQIRKNDANHLITDGQVVGPAGDDYKTAWWWPSAELAQIPDIDNLNGGQPYSMYSIVDYISPHFYTATADNSEMVQAVKSRSQKPVVNGETGYQYSDQTAVPPSSEQQAWWQTMVSAAKQNGLNGIQAWDPLPVFDLKPGTYRIDKWYPSWDKNTAWPVLVLFGPPERKIVVYGASWKLLDSNLQSLPAGKAFESFSGDTTPTSTDKFTTGDRVQTTASVNVRSTPSTSGAILGSQVTGALGTVTGGPTAANGYNWWNVNYDTAPDGWSVEDFLADAPPINIDTILPTVSITAPANGAMVSSTVNITANATDNVGVTKVEFYADGILKTTATSSPYSYIWNTTTVANGPHTLLAKAYDAAENAGQSSITVNVNNSVAASTGTLIWQIKKDGVLQSGSSVVVNANTPDGQSVNLTVPAGTYNGMSVGAYAYTYVSGGPLGATFQNITPSATQTLAPNGTITFTFNFTTTTGSDTISPKVAVISPLNGKNVSGQISVYAGATDNVGVAKVEFYVDGALKATDQASPYSFLWNTALDSPGSHILTAKAYDAAENAGQSSAVTVSVSNTAPIGTVTVRATLNGAPWDGSFVVDGSTPNGGSFTSANISTGDMPNQPIGPYTYTHKSGGPTGATLRSVTPYQTQTLTSGGNISFTFNFASTGSVNDTISPTISIASPLNGSTVSGAVTISANATDNMGVVKVEFYVDSALKTTVFTSPYSYVWFATPFGSHTLTAKAYDAAGNPGQSSAVTVNVPTAITNSAQFISQSVPSSMIAGQSYPVSVTMKNIGTNSWSAIGSQINAYRLRSENPSDNYNWGISRAELPNTVPAGSQVTINFTVTTPSAPGNYNFRWRMIQEGVQAFGQLTTNSVVVVSPPVSTDTISPAVSITSPANGATVSGWVAVNADATDNVGVAKVEFYVDGALKATDQAIPYSFSWLTPLFGSHALTAKAYDAAGNVGQSSTVTVNVLVPIVNSAQFVSQSVPATMIAGRQYPVSVTMKNIGTNSWDLIGNQINAYRLRSQNPADNIIWGISRAELPAAVPAGGQVTINFTVTAPSAPGNYNFQWRMIQEGVQAFGLYTQNVVVVVSSDAGNDTTPPTVSIISPFNGATVSGPINVNADATDNVAVVKVEFYVDNVLKASALQSPFYFSWNSLLSLPGSHTLTAKAYDAAGNVGRSSAVAVNVPTAITNSAQFVSQSVPATMIAGQQYPVSITMKNIGTNTWSPIGNQTNAYRLRSENPVDNNAWGTTRAELPNTVPAGGQVTINFTVTAPSAPGNYNFRWRMIQEGVQAFGFFTQNVAVGVVSAATSSTLSSATVFYRATLDGAPWSGDIHFNSHGTNSVTDWNGTLTFPIDIPNSPPGITWTETYVSGGPANATFQNITPSATQGITTGDITFTFNFTSNQPLSGQGTICVLSSACSPGLTCQFTPTPSKPFLRTCQPVSSSNDSASNLASVLSSMKGILEQMSRFLKGY